MKYKHLILAMIFLALANAICAQVVKIPETAKKNFSEKYPKAQQVEWSNNVTNETARFTQNGKGYKAYYDLDGKWTRTETQITEAELPAPVKDGFSKSKFASWPVKDRAKLEMPKGTFYRIHTKKDVVNDKYLMFDKEGKLTADNVTLD
jgi:hypothetical protein